MAHAGSAPERGGPDFRSLFEATPTPYVVLAADAPRFTIVAANEAYLQATMRPRDDLLGRSVFEVLPDDSAATGTRTLRDSLGRVLATRRPDVMPVHRYDVQRPDGTWEERHWKRVNTPVLGPDGAVMCLLHGTEDVTEWRRTEIERERLLQAAQAERAAVEHARERAEAAQRAAADANRAKSQFLATMSHELRTPLNAIVGYTELLEFGIAGPVSAPQRDYLARLRSSSQHLRALVDEVLDLAKVDAGQMLVAREPGVAGRAVAAALALTLPQSEAGGVRLVDACPPDAEVTYLGDEHRVRQVLLNLLSNAVKFTARGGVVTVRCGSAPHPAPAARVSGGGPWAFITVEDTGIGIAPEQQGAVFAPFVQVANDHANPYT